MNGIQLSDICGGVIVCWDDFWLGGIIDCWDDFRLGGVIDC